MCVLPTGDSIDKSVSAGEGGRTTLKDSCSSFLKAFRSYNNNKLVMDGLPCCRDQRSPHDPIGARLYHENLTGLPMRELFDHPATTEKSYKHIVCTVPAIIVYEIKMMVCVHTSILFWQLTLADDVIAQLWLQL